MVTFHSVLYVYQRVRVFFDGSLRFQLLHPSIRVHKVSMAAAGPTCSEDVFSQVEGATDGDVCSSVNKAPKKTTLM